MKNPKRPTRRQIDFIRSHYTTFNPDNWMVERDTSTEMVLVGLKGQIRTIPYANKKGGKYEY